MCIAPRPSEERGSEGLVVVRRFGAGGGNVGHVGLLRFAQWARRRVQGWEAVRIQMPRGYLIVMDMIELRALV
jgi:hypothetical protein